MRKKTEMASIFVPEAEQPYQIPDNWRWTTLDKVAEWGSGGTPSRKIPEYYDGKIPWVKTGELNDGYIFNTEEKITDDAIAHSSAKMYPPNTVILAMYGATIGKVAVLGINATTNQACACALCNPFLLPLYLFYYLRSEKESFIKKARGGAQPNISQAVIKKHAIPLPPLAEQQRIVDRIESLFSKLDAARDNAQAVLDGFETRKAAILYRAFSGELTAQWRASHNVKLSDWKNLLLRDIGDIITGSTPDTKQKRFYGGAVPFIRPADLNQGRSVSHSLDTLTEQGKAISRPVRAGTTCICCIGTIGKCGLLEVDAVTNQQINSVIPYDFMDDVYVYYYCCGNHFKNALIASSSATTISIVNKRKTGLLPILVPPKEEQREIAHILDELLETEKRVKETAEAVISQIDAMKKAILGRAFQGELGTNDPSEESPEAILRDLL